MQRIEAYQTCDGKLFSKESDAIAHEDDLIGQELDDMFKLFKLHGDIDHQSIFNACVNALKDKQRLKSICIAISNIIDAE